MTEASASAVVLIEDEKPFHYVAKMLGTVHQLGAFGGHSYTLVVLEARDYRILSKNLMLNDGAAQQWLVQYNPLFSLFQMKKKKMPFAPVTSRAKGKLFTTPNIMTYAIPTIAPPPMPRIFIGRSSPIKVHGITSTPNELKHTYNKTQITHVQRSSSAIATTSVLFLATVVVNPPSNCMGFKCKYIPITKVEMHIPNPESIINGLLPNLRDATAVIALIVNLKSPTEGTHLHFDNKSMNLMLEGFLGRTVTYILNTKHILFVIFKLPLNK
ncbi:hypothetical protein C0J52_23805 [Blattella germanica]|nr:hypothetical protein C0J52_23805 [Blattella germanica]